MELYQVNWSWSKDTERFLRNITSGKTVLSLPCGMSKVGSVRADLDPKTKPDIICSLFYPPFKPLSFDTVICDPPFNYFNKFAWMLPLSDLAKDEFILCSPKILPRLKHFSRTLYATIQRNNFFIRNWIYFKRRSARIKSYRWLMKTQQTTLYK